MAAQLELGVDEIRLGRRAQLLEPRHLEPGEGLVGEVGERRPAPQPERLAQLRRASVRVLSPPLGDEPLEAAEVRLLGRCLEHVAGIARDDHVRAERLAELRDVVLEGVLGRRRRLSGPELLDQLIGGDGLARPQQQQREQRALLLPRQRHRLAVGQHLQRAEHPELQHVRVVTPSRPVSKPRYRGVSRRPHPPANGQPTEGEDNAPFDRPGDEAFTDSREGGRRRPDAASRPLRRTDITGRHDQLRRFAARLARIESHAHRHGQAAARGKSGDRPPRRGGPDHPGRRPEAAGGRGSRARG